MDLKTKNSRKRTKKEFVDYNDYKDRPFGLKWGTAFAIDELNKVISDNKKTSMNVNEVLPLMSREEIDEVLQVAFLKSLKVTIQLNVYDIYNNIIDSISGSFAGYADKDYLYIDDTAIEWELIRHISIQ